MTISQTLKLAVTRLCQGQVDSPRLEAEILLSHVLKKPQEFILARPECRLTPKQTTNFKLLISGRFKGSPVAYLIGHKEFYGLDFFVNKNVLIPRPETELMVGEALRLIARSTKPATLVDVGTGSGCVAVTLAKLTKQKFMAIDISPQALAVARRNAKYHKVNKQIKFIQGNLLEPLFNNKFVIRNCKLIILANLPYLTPSQIKNSPSIKREPKLALDAGPDGLKYYRQLFKQIKKLRVTGYALCEIGPRQSNAIKKLVKRQLPQVKLQIKKDLAGLNRLAIIKIT